jgi:hypothetical protein
MTKTKITVISIISILTLLGIGILTFVLFQPKNSTILESPKQPIKSIQSHSSSNKQSKFENPKKVVLPPVQETEEINPKSNKFSDSKDIPIRESDLNKYTKVRDETLIYADDFDNAICESYILTLNSNQACYLSFRKSLFESQIAKIKASIVSTESSESSESDLICKLLVGEQNLDKNILACRTNNLKLQNSGDYNMTLTLSEDVLSNVLEKNIEVMTVDEFQTRFNQSFESQE